MSIYVKYFTPDEMWYEQVNGRYVLAEAGWYIADIDEDGNVGDTIGPYNTEDDAREDLKSKLSLY